MRSPSAPGGLSASDAATAAHRAATSERRQWGTLLSEEFRDWQQTQPRNPMMNRYSHPAPDTPGGLPAGWAIRDRLDVMDGRVSVYLVRRAAGGWLLVTHQPKTNQTRVAISGQTLAAMYERHRTSDDARQEWPFPETHDEITGWLTGHLLPLYDPADPVEAAEQVVVALGGPAERTPRAAEQEHCDV